MEDAINLIYILLPSLIMAIMIQTTHIPLGINILKRGIVFLDIAIAQIAGLGAIIFKVYFLYYNMLFEQLFIVGFAIVGGVLFFIIDKIKSRISNNNNELEAIIGIIYILSATVSSMVISKSPHGAEELNYILSGQIIFVTWLDVIYLSIVYIILLILWPTKDITNSNLYFYIVFAICIAISVQFAGIYVVFSSLIIPAILFYKSKYAFIKSFGFSVISVVFAIVFSAIYDHSTGVAIVLSYVLFAVIIIIFKNLKILKSKKSYT